MKYFIALVNLFFMLSIVSAQTSIGLQLYTFRNEFKQDVPGTLQKISAMGIRQIEGGGSYGLPLEEYKQLLAKISSA